MSKTLEVELVVLIDNQNQLSFKTSTTTPRPTVADLIGLIESTTAWLNKQKTELEKLPQTDPLTPRGTF